MNRDASPVIEVQRPALDNWYTQFNRTLYNNDMNHYNAQLSNWFVDSPKAIRSSFTKPITTPDQIGGLFFADMQRPFEVESMEGSMYKIGIIEAKTRFLWMTMASPKNYLRTLFRG